MSSPTAGTIKEFLRRCPRNTTACTASSKICSTSEYRGSVGRKERTTCRGRQCPRHTREPISLGHLSTAILAASRRVITIKGNHELQNKDGDSCCGSGCHCRGNHSVRPPDLRRAAWPDRFPGTDGVSRVDHYVNSSGGYPYCPSPRTKFPRCFILSEQSKRGRKVCYDTNPCGAFVTLQTGLCVSWLEGCNG
jgi:hypothetical protein